jgi:hypothetical protein
MTTDMTTDMSADTSTDSGVEGVSSQIVFELRRFHSQNAPTWAGVEAPTHGLDATDDEVRDLLLFAARTFASTPPGLPRHLEAHRVASLLPEAAGAALFARA